jgi:hypothetical protein
VTATATARELHRRREFHFGASTTAAPLSLSFLLLCLVFGKDQQRVRRHVQVGNSARDLCWNSLLHGFQQCAKACSTPIANQNPTRCVSGNDLQTDAVGVAEPPA